VVTSGALNAPKFNFSGCQNALTGTVQQRVGS
jgi:hypothetical protein